MTVFNYNLDMDITFSHTPQLFGCFHILSLLAIALFNTLFFLWAKKKNEDKLLHLLQNLGLFMILTEIFKQYFCYIYVFKRKLNLWFFPWQLCSMAMYCSFLCPLLKKEKTQNAFLVFLSSFSLMSTIAALILPMDMLRDQILLTIHSFVYHGLILSCSLTSYLILKKRKNISFLPSIYLFLFMAAIAEIINVSAHLLLNDIYIEPNMFYITLSYPSTQPVFHEIALRFSIPFEILVYLLTIILFSYLLFQLEKHFLFKS